MGEEYNANDKDCDKCQQRYYKDTVGNTKTCKECPPDKTTVGMGSTGLADCTEGENQVILPFTYQCHLLRTLANSLDPDQAQRIIGLDQSPNCLIF